MGEPLGASVWESPFYVEEQCRYDFPVAPCVFDVLQDIVHDISSGATWTTPEVCGRQQVIAIRKVSDGFCDRERQ